RAIGLAALTVVELPHHEQVSATAQAGYSHVGLRLIPVAGQPVIHALDASELERRLADTGVRVLDVEVFRLAPQTDIKEFEAVMATAQRLGATELLVHGADYNEARLIETFRGFAISPPAMGCRPTWSRCPGWTFRISRRQCASSTAPHPVTAACWSMRFISFARGTACKRWRRCRASSCAIRSSAMRGPSAPRTCRRSSARHAPIGCFRAEVDSISRGCCAPC